MGSTNATLCMADYNRYEIAHLAARGLFGDGRWHTEVRLEPAVPAGAELATTTIGATGFCSSPVCRQLNDCLNFKGETFVLVLKSLLNDCECPKPNS